MSKPTLATLATAVTALEARADATDAKLDLILAAVTGAQQPAAPVAAPVTQPKADEPNEFVTWLRDTAEQRAARKSSNREMAAWMRSKGLEPNGAAWEACKKGERNVRTLKKLASA